MSTNLASSACPSLEQYTLWVFDGLRWSWVTDLVSIANAKLVLNRYTGVSAVIKKKGYRKRNAPAVARFYFEAGQWHRGAV